MKTLIALLLAIGLGVYWFGLRAECGRTGALACPDPSLEEGVGTELSAKEVCIGAGYLCNQEKPFQVVRWPLDKGKLRVRVSLPDFAKGRIGEQIRAAAVEGIMQWDNRPFPLVIDAGRFTYRFWDIGVVWSEGLVVAAAGMARPRWEFSGKRVDFGVEGLSVVVPPPGSMSTETLLKRVREVASHEMGHSLGIIIHSDRPTDIMFPSLNSAPAGPSARDFRTIEALYALPNGAMVR